jgi:hypothetical protein
MSVFVAVTPPGGIFAATGLPGATPAPYVRFVSLTIYELSAGVYTSQGAANVYWPMLHLCPGGHLVEVTPDGTGAYVISTKPATSSVPNYAGP